MKSWLDSSWLAAFGRRAAGAPTPIGVDFAAQRLNMVQTATPGGSPVLRAALSLPYPLERAQF